MNNKHFVCQHCGEPLQDEPRDTTYCNYNSKRYSAGTHTGNVYDCTVCEGMTIELVQEGGVLETFCYE